MAQKEDQKFIEDTIKAIVDNPTDVTTERTIDERGVLITLKVNPEDMGQIIGRKGNTIRAVRTLLRVLGARSNARLNLKIYEPEGSRHIPREATETTESPVATETTEGSMDDVEDLKL